MKTGDVQRKIAISVALLLISTCTFSQPYLNYQLRLEPVWSRVADALGEPGSVESAEFSPDGKYIVSGTKFDNSVVMWRTSDGAELWRQYAKQEIERVGWSADGRYVAAGSEDFLVTIYNAKTGAVEKTIKHTQGIDGLVWSNKGNLLVTGEEGTEMENGTKSGWLRVVSMPEAKEITKINYGGTINRVYFSNDDQYLLAIGHGDPKVYRVSDWSLVQTLKTDQYVNFASGVISPDNQYVIGVGSTGEARGNVFIWDIKSAKLLKRFNHTGKKIETVAWHPNGKYIVHAGHDPYLYVYRVADILQFGNDAIPVAHQVWAGDHSEYVDLNADGSFLVSAHQNGLIKLWVWMGEDSDLNAKRHSWISKEQEAAQKEQK